MSTMAVLEGLVKEHRWVEAGLFLEDHKKEFPVRLYRFIQKAAGALKIKEDWSQNKTGQKLESREVKQAREALNRLFPTLEAR